MSQKRCFHRVDSTREVDDVILNSIFVMRQGEYCITKSAYVHLTSRPSHDNIVVDGR